LLLCWAAAAAGQGSGDGAPQPPEEIVVTGERVKRSVRDTASSVSVFDQKDMERMSAPDRIQQLLQMVPNVLTPTSRDAPNIRGQSSVGVLAGLPGFLGGARPRMAMQIDGRTVTFNEFVNSSEGLWDVDHVEVFRGPQTTTQGVNSIGGAIFIHTADPSYDIEARARTIVGQSRRRQVSALASGPLAGDELALRISGDIYRSVASTRMSGPVVGIRDLNVDRYWTGRAKLLAEPHAVPGLRVLATYAHTHSRAPQGELAKTPFRKRRDDGYIFGYFKSDVDSVTALVTYAISDSLESRTTLSWGRSHFRRFAPQGFGQTRIRGNDRSLESVLEWKPAGPVSAVGGIAFQRVELRQFIDLSNANLGTGSFDDKQPSEGAFGELTWRVADRLSLTAGARYQRDGKRRTGVLRMSPDLPLDYDRTTRAFLPKVSLAYDLTPEVRVGLLVQRAYNPGGVTLDPEHRAQIEFKPEYLWDYEAFTRASLLGGRVTATGNLFYNAIRDAQRELEFDLSSPSGSVGLLQIISEPRARAYGAELEITARPSPRLTLMAGLGLLDTKIIEGVAPRDPFIDKEFFGAPHLTAAGGADWEAARKLHLSAQVRRVSGFAGDDAETAIIRTKGFWMADARAAWDTRRFTLFAYVQNVFDTFQVIGWAGPRDNPDVHVGVTDPREMGFGIEARF
jgi:outer membrane receptor protein involved in Fe transport